MRRKLECVAMLVLAALAVSCSAPHSASSANSPQALSSLSGNWTVSLAGSTQNTFGTTFVSEAIVNLSIGAGCNLPTSAGVIGASALNLVNCFIADNFSEQGSVSCPGCTNTPQAVLAEAEGTNAEISSVNIVMVETDPIGTVFQFSGQGTVTNGTISGSWTCDTSSSCQGWSGTFSITPN